ncbi:ABC transporter ATP-binding protein [Sphingobacterium kyonggiense]|uniref:ABC transporter ATP-binding protein n=2 Tax=Sphingobacterium kyonggiense TaxID=714075 RepID=A0ABP7YR69_9SPHI
MLGGTSIPVLQDINFEIEEGATVSIVGPSGSGKTTLLGLCAGLDQPSSGTIHLNGIQLTGLNEDKLATIRNEHVGFVFQNFQLLPTLTALENVLVPLELRGIKVQEQTAKALLERVGLGHRSGHYPSQLSGGEQQRVSIARAFANKPKILFADEPTGNLDAETSQSIEDMIFELNRESGTTLVIVTHDLDLAAKTQQIIPIKGGRIA